MTEQEERDLARRLSDSSSVLDFETALEIVRRRPTKAEEMIRNREKVKRNQEEMARLRERRRRSLIEEFG